jgi:glycine cleavage system H lipoate-binding protein
MMQIAGEITAINEDIERDAEVFLSPQPEHSWLYKLKLTDENRTTEGFLNAEEYRNYLIKIGWLA